MVKKHLLWLQVLLTHTLFAYKEINIADSNLNRVRAVNETNYEIPEGFAQDPAFWLSYRDLDLSVQQMIEFLGARDHQQVKALSYTTKKGITSKQDYLVLHFPSLMHSKGVNTNYLSFMWVRKKYSNTTETEKKIADYYHAKSSDQIEFLYPYLKSNTDPWAIKIGNQLHATIWVKTKVVIKPSQMAPRDPFVVLEPKDEGYEIHLLIDENRQVIAKRIHDITTFKERSLPPLR